MSMIVLTKKVDNRLSNNKVHHFVKKEHVTSGTWYVTCDMWHMTCDMKHMGELTFFQNVSFLAWTVWDLCILEDWEE